MKKTLTLDDLGFSNKDFWISFVAVSFPTALDEETDMSLVEIIKENEPMNIEWWNNFTGYYDGVFEEFDGYVDSPTTFIYNLSPTQTLKIEFHPGDIVYYINDEQIGCLGGEYNIQTLPFRFLLKDAGNQMDERIFLLLLPLAKVEKQEAARAVHITADIMEKIFDTSYSNQFAGMIVYGLMEGHA